MLWYLRTQLDIEILPENIKQAAQHFEDSFYKEKLWADILEEAAIDAMEDIPSVSDALIKYRKGFDQKHFKEKSNKMNPIVEKELLPSSTINCWKIGFFAAASVAAAAVATTTLVLTSS